MEEKKVTGHPTTYGCPKCCFDFEVTSVPAFCPLCGYQASGDAAIECFPPEFSAEEGLVGGPRGGFAIGGFDRT